MAEPLTPTPAEPSPQPRSIRLRALAGLLMLGIIAGGVWAFVYWEPRLMPVRLIEVQGEVHNHSSDQLQEILAERLRGGFLTADLKDLQDAAAELAWVGRVSIRRVWPDRLQVRVLEHRPVARWRGDGLVTAEGVIFRPRGGAVPVGLPLLEGDESRARELVARYLKWRDSLMLVGHLIDSLTVDARGAWTLGLVSKTRVELGATDVEQRLARFIGAAPQLDAAGRAAVVDLRYSNGFAVRWVPNEGGGAPAQSAPASRQAQQQVRKPSATQKGRPVLAQGGDRKRLPGAQRPVAAVKARPQPNSPAASSRAAGSRSTPPKGAAAGSAPARKPAPGQRQPAPTGSLPGRALTQATG